jgi:uncharacterized protein (TIGR00369 family)
MAALKLPAALAPDLGSRLAARLQPFPLIAGWDIRILELAPGRALLGAGPSPRMQNPNSPVINGGVLATVADMVCALALSTAFDGAMPFATSDLHIRYLEPATGALEAEAEVVRLSPRSAVIECRLRCETTIVALCTCQFAVKG